VRRPRRNSPAASAALLGAILLTLASAPTLAAAVRASPDAAAEAAEAAYAAAMQGRKATALTDVQQLIAALPAERARAAGDSGWELTPQYAVLVRFGLWDELIALERPATQAPGLTAGYLYGRGVALAVRGRTEEARAALAELERLGASVAPGVRARANALNAVIGVAAAIVAARIAASEYRVTDAVAALEQAVAAEDRLARDEPPDWFFPVRDLLGAELLLAGRAADAERVYRESLRRNPGNGWALNGLAAALHAQRQLRAAAAQRHAFAAAWKAADVRLQSSAFWFGGPDNSRCECERQDAATH
jgi:tetratricopeptide (TPR) repeat protein